MRKKPCQKKGKYLQKQRVTQLSDLKHENKVKPLTLKNLIMIF